MVIKILHLKITSIEKLFLLQNKSEAGCVALDYTQDLNYSHDSSFTKKSNDAYFPRIVGRPFDRNDPVVQGQRSPGSAATKFTVPTRVSTLERILLSAVLKLYVFLHNSKLEIIIVAPSGTPRYRLACEPLGTGRVFTGFYSENRGNRIQNYILSFYRDHFHVTVNYSRITFYFRFFRSTLRTNIRVRLKFVVYYSRYTRFIVDMNNLNSFICAFKYI